MSRYRVTAPLVIAHDQDRRANHHYAGAVIPWLSDGQRRHLLGLGMVEEIADATPPGVVGPNDEGDDDPVITQQSAEQPPENLESNSGQTDPPARPPQIANKEVWVNWAVEAKGLSREQAEAMTLVDLKALD